MNCLVNARQTILDEMMLQDVQEYVNIFLQSICKYILKNSSAGSCGGSKYVLFLSRPVYCSFLLAGVSHDHPKVKFPLTPFQAVKFPLTTRQISALVQKPGPSCC